jgi:hypothetical protein
MARNRRKLCARQLRRTRFLSRHRQPLISFPPKNQRAGIPGSGASRVGRGLIGLLRSQCQVDAHSGSQEANEPPDMRCPVSRTQTHQKSGIPRVSALKTPINQQPWGAPGLASETWDSTNPQVPHPTSAWSENRRLAPVSRDADQPADMGCPGSRDADQPADVGAPGLGMLINQQTWGAPGLASETWDSTNPQAPHPTSARPGNRAVNPFNTSLPPHPPHSKRQILRRGLQINSSESLHLS